jgi:hypothetical protein
LYKLSYFTTFLGLLSANSDILFSTNCPSTTKRLQRICFADGSDNPSQIRLEVALGQRKVCQLLLHLSEREKKSAGVGDILQIGRLADGLDVFVSIKSPD